MTDISLPAAFAGAELHAGRNAEQSTGEFRVGRVLERAAAVLSRNFVPFLIVSAIAAAPSQLGSLFPTGAAGPHPIAQYATVIGALIGWFLSILAQAIVVYGAVSDLRGHRVDLAESFKMSLRRFVPLFLATAVVGALAGLGMVALVVPGVILFIMFYVVPPVCLIEQRGVWASIGRSAELTKGHRWKIFGLVLLLALAGAVLGGVVGGALGVLKNPAITFVGMTLVNGAAAAFGAVLTAVAYHDLRVAKEGIDVEQVAAVFA